MNYYQLSYDVIDSDRTADRNRVVLKELMKTLIGVKASCIGRYVATTIMFLSEQPCASVCTAIKKWASAQETYYVLSQVRSAGINASGTETYFYAVHKNTELQSDVDELLAQIKNEIESVRHV